MFHAPKRPVRAAAALLFALCAACAAPVARAQDYPARLLKFYIGFAAGGSADLVSRLLAQKLQDRLGQTVVAEPKIGATGIIAQDAVAKAAPDGLSLVLLTGGHPTSAVLFRKLPYDPVRDFGMVSLVTQYPMVISVLPTSPMKSLADLIARAKAEPGKVTYTTSGVGSLHHLLGEWMNIEAGTEMVQIPFKGAGPAYTEMLGGRVDVMIETMTFTSGQLKAGRLRALAQSAATRVSSFPDIPAVAETLPQIEFQSWLGVVTSPGTPRPIIDRLNREVREVLNDRDVRQRLADLGGEAAPSTPDELRARVEREVQRWGRVVELRKIEKQ